MWTLLILIILSTYANAAVLTSDSPVITPRALLPRGDSILGYYSGGQTGSETVWNAYNVDTDKYSFTISGNYYRFCSRGYTCYMSYSCSSGYIFYESSAKSTSSFCGISSSTCISHLLYSSFGDYDPMTQYWCLERGYTGMSFYRTKPGPRTTLSDTFTISIPSTGPIATTSPPLVRPPTTVPEPTSPKLNTGIIVGGVVGGIALIGIIGLVAILLLRRKRAQPIVQQPIAQQPATTYYSPPDKSLMPNGLVAKNVQPTTIAVDPHASFYYGSGLRSPTTPASPAPQYAIHTPPHGVELPLERM